MLVKTPATIVLAAINVIVFLLMLAANTGNWSPQFLVDWGGNYGRLTFAGEQWRLVSAMFVHGGIDHIGGNLVCLLAWGGLTEAILGTRRFVLAYFVSGLLASLASAWLHPAIVSVGASGAIASTLGLMVVMRLRGDGRISAGGLLANIALNAFISLLPSVDWAGHLVGFATGLALGPFLFPASFVQKPVEPGVLTADELAHQPRPAAPVSFREPMDFPKGSIVYRARDRLVATLPDWTLIADDGAGGLMFANPNDYREKTGDTAEWDVVKEFN